MMKWEGKMSLCQRLPFPVATAAADGPSCFERHFSPPSSAAGRPWHFTPPPRVFFFKSFWSGHYSCGQLPPLVCPAMSTLRSTNTFAPPTPSAEWGSLSQSRPCKARGATTMNLSTEEKSSTKKKESRVLRLLK